MSNPIDIAKLKIIVTNKLYHMCNDTQLITIIQPLYEQYFIEWNKQIGSTNNKLMHDFIENQLLNRNHFMQHDGIKHIVYAMNNLDFNDFNTRRFFEDFLTVLPN